MTLLLLRACPRCGGTLETCRDFYGSYRNCVNCGFSSDVLEVPTFILEEEEAVKTGETLRRRQPKMKKLVE